MKKSMILLLMILITPISIIKSQNSLNFENENISTIENNNIKYFKGTGNVINDKGIKTRQDVNLFIQEEDIKVVNWSKFYNGKYLRDNVLEIAKDFELNNPKYEVVAGVNGDYFIDETVNANVIFGNKVINPKNHNKYDSLEFNQKGEFINVHNDTKITSNYFLSLYKDDQLMNYLKVKDVNNNNLVDTETTVFMEGADVIKEDNAKYYPIKAKNVHRKQDHLFIEGTIDKSLNTNDQYVIATKNQDLINKIEDGMKIIFQTEIEGIEYGNMVIGYDNHILKDNYSLEFSELAGQSPANNTARHPRTGFGFTKDGKFALITVDGRGESKGVDLREFSTIMKHFEFENGFNLDGGGSTQAVFKDNTTLTMVNNPSDKNPYRRVGNALLFVKEKETVVKYEYETNNDSFVFSLDKSEDIDAIKVYIDGIENKFSSSDEINIKDLKDNTSISIVIEAGNLTYTLINDVIGQNQEKFVPENADIDITHSYKDNELEIHINYIDPYSTIRNVRVYLNEYDLDYPALIEHQGLRISRFGIVELKGSHSVTIEVRYNNKEIKEYIYNFEVKKDKTYIYYIIIPLLIVMTSGTLLLRKFKK